jgi:hypothetical protein
MTAAGVPLTRMRFMRPFTARVINPLTRRFAGWLTLVEPRLIVDPELRDMPWPLGTLLGRINRVTEILEMPAG